MGRSYLVAFRTHGQKQRNADCRHQLKFLKICKHYTKQPAFIEAHVLQVPTSPHVLSRRGDRPQELFHMPHRNSAYYLLIIHHNLFEIRNTTEDLLVLFSLILCGQDRTRHTLPKKPRLFPDLRHPPQFYQEIENVKFTSGYVYICHTGAEPS